MEIGHVINVGPDQYQGGRVLQPGEVIETWCSKCGHKTPHKFQPTKWPPMVCLTCHPEKRNE